jgi:hypothetical protein
MVFRIIIFLLFTTAYSYVFADIITYGFLKGVVKTDAGIICANEKVVVTTGDQKLNYVTDALGAFNTMIPSGDATILVMESTKTVKIIEGETTACDIIVVRPGVTLTINNLVAGNMDYYISGSYMLNGTAVTLNNQQRLLNGKYFFQMPAEATTLAITATFNRGIKPIIPSNSIHKVWKFETKEATRNLTLDYVKPVQIPIKVSDDIGKVIPDGTKITGRLSWNYPKNQVYDDWMKVDLNDTTRRQSVSENFDTVKIITTVAGGAVLLPECMTGASYTLQLSIDGGTRGNPTPIIVAENGKPDVDAYQFTPRRVSMTVFDNAGKPAANAIVNGSYIVDGKVKLISVKSDENGIVNLSDIPPVRVTVWGDNIPVGILPANVVKVTTPLEAPQKVSSSMNLKFTVEKVSGICVYKPEVKQDFQTRMFNTTTDSPYYNNVTYGYMNSPITLYLMTDEDIPRCKVLSLYIPYNDSPDASIGSTGILEINDFDVAPSANINIMNSDGVTPAQFNQLSITSDVYVKEISQSYAGLLIKVTRTDKGIVLRSALPGTYKLMIDMMSDPYNPAAEVSLPSKDIVKVVLKNESANLPGGSIVNWVDYSNPLEIHTMTLPADAEKPEATVYYDKNKILGWWSKTAPNNLRICTNGEVKTLLLKTFTIKHVDENGKEITNPNSAYYFSSLMPLFPQTGNYYQGQQNTSAYNIVSNSEQAVVNLTNKARVNLWMTKYLLTSNNQKTSTMMEMTKETPGELLIKKLPTVTVNNPPMNNKFISVLNENGRNNLFANNSDMMVIPDDDISKKKIIRRDNNFLINFPDTTGKITIIYPAVGIAKDVPYKFVDNYLHLKTTDFKPLTTVKGKLYDTKGAVVKNSQVSIAFAGIPDSGCGLFITKATDAEGNFSFENIPAGTYQLTDNGSVISYRGMGTSKPCMWLIKVPEDKPEFIFDMKPIDSPLYIRPANFNNNSGNTVGTYAWLWQDGTDKAIQIPFSRSVSCIHDNKPKNGILLIYSAVGSLDKIPFYSRVNWDAKLDANNIMYSTNQKLPIISFISPLIENTTYPTTVTITGTGPWEDVKYNQVIQWQFYSGLNSAISRFGSMAPGDWIIKITTTAGKVIEKKITVGSSDMSVRIDVQ